MDKGRCAVKKKIGVLGGTFNPIHNGHLQMVEAAEKCCALDEIFFIPAAVPPHKTDETIAPFYHRAKMVELALSIKPNCHLSKIEEYLPKPSYTVDTLVELRKDAGEGVEFFFIIGADAFLDIMTWKSYPHLLSYCNFIVVARSGYSVDQLHGQIFLLGYLQEGNCWIHRSHKMQLILISAVIIDVSSSSIRERANKSLSLDGLVPDPVGDYIKEHCLYKKRFRKGSKKGVGQNG